MCYESNYKPIISPNYTNLKTNSNKKKNKTKKLDSLIHFSNLTTKKNNNSSENISLHNNNIK